MSKKENSFQSKLIKKLGLIFPGCLVLKNDANYIQGIPDLTLFYKDHWAFLECKRHNESAKQNNQNYYIQYANNNSFGAFINQDNEEEVLHELQQAFGY